MEVKFVLLVEISEQLNDWEEIEDFRDTVLRESRELLLHSNFLGDTLNGGNPIKVHLVVAEPEVCKRCGGTGTIGDAEPCDLCCGTGINNLCEVTDAMFDML